MRRMAWLMCLVLASCGREQSAATASTSAAAATSEDCAEFDEFAQEYEATDDLLALQPMGQTCPESRLAGPPLFPIQQMRVRIEYRQGDFFVHQETRGWSIEPDPARGCALITPDISHAYRKRVGADDETALLGTRKTVRSRDGQEVPQTLHFGRAEARLPRNAPESMKEDTSFGVQCLRIDSSNTPGVMPGHSMCKIQLPRKCRSELHLAPVELIAPAPGIKGQVGRTTSLSIGPDAGVDPASWQIP